MLCLENFVWYFPRLSPLECIHSATTFDTLITEWNTYCLWVGIYWTNFCINQKNIHKYPLSVADTTTATPAIDVTSKWFKSKILNALATHNAYVLTAYCNLLEWSCSSYEYIRRERVPNGRTDRLTDTNWIFFLFFESSPNFVSFTLLVLTIWHQNTLMETRGEKKKGETTKKKTRPHRCGCWFVDLNSAKTWKKFKFSCGDTKKSCTWNSLIHLIWHSLKIKSSDTWAATAIHFAHSSSCLSASQLGHMLWLVYTRCGYLFHSAFFLLFSLLFFVTIEFWRSFALSEWPTQYNQKRLAGTQIN